MKENLMKLRKNHEFKRVYRMGRKISGKYSVLYYNKNGMEDNRFGFSVSKKVGKSVCRHRIKRLYFESLRRMKNNLKKGHDFVLVARRGASEMDFNSCRDELENLLKKAYLWEDKGD